MLSQLVSILLPVYLCAGVGFLWVRAGRRYDTRLVTDLVMWIGAPCLAFSSLVGVDLAFAEIVQMAGATLLATVCLALAAGLLLRLTRTPLASFLAPMTFGNTGNMGVPICYFAFGDAGLALGVCFYATTALLHFTVGQWMWSGRASIGQLLRTPLAWATGIAFAMKGFDLPAPEWLLRTTSLLGDFTIPLMQITLGVSLAQIVPSRIPRNLALAGLKLGLGAAVGFGVAGALQLEGVARGVVVLDCAMPVAVFNYMFAVSFDRSPSDVASVVVLSTLLSFLTLPLVLAAVL